MQKTLLTSFLMAGFAVLASAAPVIGTGGVLNAASNALPGLPNSAIAQGSIFVIYGVGLGPPPPEGTAVTSGPFPLPKVLPSPNGTSVSVKMGSTSVDALLIYTSPTQIAAVLPSKTPVGTGQITVTYRGATSPAAPITVVANSVGIFTLNQGGSGPAVVQNFVTATSLPVNTLTSPATPGQTLILYGTGLGPVAFDESQPAQSGTVGANDFELDVGGIPASVTYHGRSACCAGLDQINFMVPAGADGCYVPVSIRDGGVISNFTTISVSPNGQPCNDPTGFSASNLVKIVQGLALNAAVITLTHTITQKSPTTTGIGPGQRLAASGAKDTITTEDTAAGLFFSYDAGVIKSQGLNRTPSPGSCLVFTSKGNSPSTDPFQATPLDAGPVVNLKGGPTNSSVQLAPLLQAPGIYIPGGALLPGFVGAGRYTAINGFGGIDIKGFDADVTFHDPLIWNSQDSFTSVTRSQGVNVSWSGGSPGDLVEITGSGPAFTSTLQPLSQASFTCVAHWEDGQFTVPPAVLESLPPNTPFLPGIATGTLGVAGFSYSKFGATGLDLGLFIRISSNVSTVIYQ